MDAENRLTNRRPESVGGLGGAVVGVDLGGTEIKTVTILADGRIRDIARTSSPRGQGPQAVLDATVAAMDRGIARASRTGVRDESTGVVDVASWLTGVLDPQVIVVGGGLSAAGEQFFEPLRTTYVTGCLTTSPPAVAGAHFGSHAGAGGALLGARVAKQ